MEGAPTRAFPRLLKLCCGRPLMGTPAGAVPNLFWGAISFEELRGMSACFAALPPCPQLAGPPTYRRGRPEQSSGPTRHPAAARPRAPLSRAG